MCQHFHYHHNLTQTQGITLVIAEEKTFKSGKEVLPLLDAVLADPTGMTPAILMKMQSLQTIIESNLPIVIKQRKGICLIAMVYSVCFGLIGSGGLYVIRQLRESE